MIWLKDATLTQLKICKKCWHNVQKVASSYASSTALLYFPQQSSDRVNISNRMCEWHFAKASYNTGPEWFSLVWCWWQGPISGMSLDMIFTILIRLSDLVLSRDNTITVLKIMHFLGFFNLCMCAIGVPKMFCLLGHFFFSFKGLSYKYCMIKCLLQLFTCWEIGRVRVNWPHHPRHGQPGKRLCEFPDH